MRAPTILSKISSMSKLPSIVNNWILSTTTRKKRVDIANGLNDRNLLKQAGSKIPQGMNSRMFPKKFNRKRKTIEEEITGVVNKIQTLFNGMKLLAALRYSEYVKNA